MITIGEGRCYLDETQISGVVEMGPISNEGYGLKVVCGGADYQLTYDQDSQSELREDWQNALKRWRRTAGVTQK